VNVSLKMKFDAPSEFCSYEYSPSHCGSVARWSSGYSVGLATRPSRVEFPAAATNNGMADCLGADKPPQYFTKPRRPTPSPTLSGTGNDMSTRQSAATPGGWGVKRQVWFNQLVDKRVIAR